MATFLTIAHALGILTALHAVMHARTSQGSFAWAIGLVGFPVLAVPLYWIFGRSKFRGYTLAYRQNNEDVRRKLAEIDAVLDSHRKVLDGDQKRFDVVQALARAPFTGRNRAELLVDGDATFKSIFEGIEWSSEKVLRQTLDKAESAGLGVRLLEVKRDIDRYGDLEAYYRSVREGRREPLGRESWEVLESILGGRV